MCRATLPPTPPPRLISPLLTFLFDFMVYTIARLGAYRRPSSLRRDARHRPSRARALVAVVDARSRAGATAVTLRGDATVNLPPPLSACRATLTPETPPRFISPLLTFLFDLMVHHRSIGGVRRPSSLTDKNASSARRSAAPRPATTGPQTCALTPAAHNAQQSSRARRRRSQPQPPTTTHRHACSAPSLRHAATRRHRLRDPSRTRRRLRRPARAVVHAAPRAQSRRSCRAPS